MSEITETPRQTTSLPEPTLATSEGAGASAPTSETQAPETQPDFHSPLYPSPNVPGGIDGEAVPTQKELQKAPEGQTDTGAGKPKEHHEHHGVLGKIEHLVEGVFGKKDKDHTDHAHKHPHHDHPDHTHNPGAGAMNVGELGGGIGSGVIGAGGAGSAARGGY